MNTYSNLKLDSYVQTNKVLAENVSIYESLASTKAQANSFAVKLKQLLALRDEIDESLLWLITEKNKLKINLCDKLYPFSNALVCYANSVSDNEIFAKMNMVKTKLKRLSELNLIVFYNQAVAIAKAHLASLESSGISEAIVTALEADFNAFQQKRTDLIKLREDKVNAKLSFRSLQKEVNKLLNNKLDRSVENLRANNLDFVNYYFAARQKAKGAQRHFDVLGYLKDKATGEPISLGKVSVKGLDLWVNITEKGAFRFKHFPEGEYRLIIENINYKTLYVSIRRYASERSKLYLTMEAIPLETTRSVE